MLLNAWAINGLSNAPSKAKEMLNLMKKLHNEQGHKVKPNFVTFANVMQAWSNFKTCEEYGAAKAESIMKDLLQLCDLSNNYKNFQPSMQTQNMSIDSQAKCVAKLESKALENAFHIFCDVEMFGKQHNCYASDAASHNIVF